MSFLKKPSTLIAVLVLLGCTAGYYFLFGQQKPDNVSIASAGTTSETQATFLALAGRLEQISFDASILSDPRFMRLVDLTTAIVPETAGRPDPFAPLPGVAAE